MADKNEFITCRIAALAGRRPDIVNAEKIHFPLANVANVRVDIRNVFTGQKITHLVCSAACGADLIALEVADELEIESHIILPFSSIEFRKTSVTDRPGDWGKIYDRIIKKAEEEGNLHLLGYSQTDKKAYFKATQEIIALASQLAGDSPAFAIIVWEGESRGDDDATQEFVELSRKADFYKIEIPTL